MKKSRLWASIIVYVGLVGGLLAFNLSVGNTPVLGLDLKGGLSVIYATETEADEEQLVIVRDLMREQLEDFGIAEPDVRVEGENIIVDLPGVNDQESAFEALQVSGIVTLRPVIACGPGVPADPSAGQVALPRADGEGDCVVGDDMVFIQAFVDRELGTLNGQITESSIVRVVDVDGSEASFIRLTLAPTADPAVVTELIEASNVQAFTPTIVCSIDEASGDSVCDLTFSAGTGGVFAQGSAGTALDQQGGWVVNVDLTSSGSDYWNSLAQECFSGAGDCPSRQLAIVLDDVIQSAPVVQTPDFPGNVQISGSFTEDEVRSLSRVLNRGAFPVPVEQQRVETVSATAGQDSLNAAVIAGLIGLAAVLVFMVAYYRKLSVVIIAGLLVWGMTVFTLATIVSQATNFALTLAGATGIIVAVGVTVDTYVVFFERLKDEVRHGRTMRNAAPRSFNATWRTIVSADLVSLMASLILFWLSVGSVKGFALYLGLTTICDLLVFYFFTRPSVFLLSMTNWFDDNAERESIPVPAAGATA